LSCKCWGNVTEGKVLSTSELNCIHISHTLILGTHPSITSLGKSQYYGHIMKWGSVARLATGVYPFHIAVSNI